MNRFTDTINVNNSNDFNILENQKVFVGNSITYNFASYNSGLQLNRYYSSSAFYDFDFPFYNKELDVKATLYFDGYVDDYLNVFLNNSLILSRHLGGWTLCHNWDNIYCSPILSPKTINLTALNEHNTIQLRAVNSNSYTPGARVWLLLNSVKVVISYKSK